MKAAIKHNLLLLKRVKLVLIFLIIILIGTYIKAGTGLFVTVIPTVVIISVFTMEEIDREKYGTLFSLPITRSEFAKAKVMTLLIIYVAAMLFILSLYFLGVLIGITKAIDVIPFLLELVITFPLSIFLGGIGVGFVGSIHIFYPLFMHLLILNIDVELQLGQDIILDALVVIILSFLIIASYVGTRNSIINRYTDMELH